MDKRIEQLIKETQIEDLSGEQWRDNLAEWRSLVYESDLWTKSLSDN